MLSLIRRIRVLTMDSGYIGWAARIKLIHEIPMDNKPFSVTNSLDSRPLVNAMIFIIAIAMILVGCISDKQTPQAVESSSLLPKPDPLPDWLREVRPISSSVITQDQYKIVITPDYVYEGPPPPPVEVTGLRSSVCVDIDVETLVEPGDLLFWEEDILKRIQLFVDGKELRERAETEYLAVIEPGPECRCFYDCEEDWERWDWASESPPENMGCWFWPGFWYCYPVELNLGQHEATSSFEKTSGDIASYTQRSLNLKTKN